MGFAEKSNGAIFIYTRQYSEVLRPSCLTTVFFCRFAIPFKQTVFEAFTDLKERERELNHRQLTGFIFMWKNA